MANDSLPPIPTPPAQRWREFRIQVLPVILFLVLVTAVAGLWRTYVIPSNIVGLAETNTVYVTTTEAGLLTELVVQQLENVAQDQVLGIVTVYDPEYTKAALAAVESDVRLLHARMSLDEIRSREVLTKLRLDLLTQETLLSIAKEKLKPAEAAYQRADELFRSNIWSAAQYEPVRAARDVLKSEVEDRTRLVQAWEEQVKRAEPIEQSLMTNQLRLVDDDITRKQEEIRQLHKPIVLRAPISGQVSLVTRRTGERVMRGEPILSIAATNAGRIMAFVRQPITVHPQVGDKVMITTRGRPRVATEGTIVKIGSQLELIPGTLVAPDRPRRASEMGLPLAINIPPEVRLQPGEMVTLALHRK